MSFIMAMGALEVFVGLFQCCLIWFGLRQMASAARDRTKQVNAQVDYLKSQGEALEKMGKNLEQSTRSIEMLLKAPL